MCDAVSEIVQARVKELQHILACSRMNQQRYSAGVDLLNYWNFLKTSLMFTYTPTHTPRYFQFILRPVILRTGQTSVIVRLYSVIMYFISCVAPIIL